MAQLMTCEWFPDVYKATMAVLGVVFMGSLMLGLMLGFWWGRSGVVEVEVQGRKE